MIVYGFEFSYIELIALGLMFGMFLYQLYFYSRYIFGVLRLRKHTIKNKVSFNDVQAPVSVIICSKDEVDNLRKYLPFVLAQDYPDFEVIVVNDGSTDESEIFLRWYLFNLLPHCSFKFARTSFESWSSLGNLSARPQLCKTISLI